MANFHSPSNISTVVIPKFMEAFKANRVILNTVDRQAFDGKFTPAVGTTLYIKRPHDTTSAQLRR